MTCFCVPFSTMPSGMKKAKALSAPIFIFHAVAVGFALFRGRRLRFPVVFNEMVGFVLRPFGVIKALPSFPVGR